MKKPDIKKLHKYVPYMEQIIKLTTVKKSKKHTHDWSVSEEPYDFQIGHGSNYYITGFKCPCGEFIDVEQVKDLINEYYKRGV